MPAAGVGDTGDCSARLPGFLCGARALEGTGPAPQQRKQIPHASAGTPRCPGPEVLSCSGVSEVMELFSNSYPGKTAWDTLRTQTWALLPWVILFRPGEHGSGNTDRL